ncbi:MAG: hypothetical protein ACPGQD_04355 [Planctomycetota bacterium]
MIQDLDSGKRGVRQTMAARVTYADDGADVPFPSLPAGTVLHACYRKVTELFNDSGTDTLKVGTSSNDDSLCDTGDTTMTSTGYYTDVVASSTGVVLEAATQFLARYDGQNGDASTGVVDVYIDVTICGV